MLLLYSMALDEVVVLVVGGASSRKGWSVDEVVGGASSRMRRGMDKVVGRGGRRSVVERGYDDLILIIGKVYECYRDVMAGWIGNHHRGGHSVRLRGYRDGRGNDRNLLC